LQEKWDETEEKPAVVAITLSAFVAIWAASGAQSTSRSFSFGGISHAFSCNDPVSCSHESKDMENILGLYKIISQVSWML
jgi:hypothetical protein